MALYTLITFLCITHIAPQAVVLAKPIQSRVATGKAVYLMTNDATNNVVALPIGANGMLSTGSCTATGGAGSNAIDGLTNQPGAPDALVSQSALTVTGNTLFAVNAGSNTLSMFTIDKTDPAKITMVGKPIAVSGEFPNTVAASDKNKVVCVGSTGAVAGISCASFSTQGVGNMDSLRPVDLQQTTPPVGPTNTISQVFFSNDQNTLFTTVKGDPAKNKTGFLGSFQVKRSCGGQTLVSQQGSMSSPQGTAVLFGSSTIPGSNDLFVTDASFGAAVLSVDPRTGAATLKGKGSINGQKATCWAAVSAQTNTAFVTDVGVNHVVEMYLADASVKQTIDLGVNGDPGLIDLKTAGNFLYALSPGNGTTKPAVTVIDLKSKQQVQHLELQDLGVSKNAQGMAVLM